MKIRNPVILILWISCILLGYTSAYSQLPPRHWSAQFGGSDVEVPFSIKSTSDGGTIVAGYTTSKDGDITNFPEREYWDLWVVKLDVCGNIMWQQSFGGKGYESARDIVQTPDGGFMVLGETNSTDGGVIPGFGGTKDIWLLKLDINGTLIWQKRLGGTGLDVGNQLVMLDDGNFLIAATTSSNDGDISGNHGTGGYTDGVLIKTDPAGNIIWSKCYGGTRNEELMDIEVINGRIYVAGYANSTDGDIPANQKNYDVWLLTVDQAGNIVSNHIYGGSQNDVAYSMTKGNDGTLTLSGYTTSTDGDVTEAKGSQDYWILNVNTDGNLNWQKTLGGTDAEYATTIITDLDGGYIVGGISYSSDGDINDARGEGDFWLVKLNVGGTPVWKQSMGGTGNDYLRSMFQNAATNEYYVTGDSGSDDGDFTDSNGETDFAVLKLKLTDTVMRDSIVCELAGFSADPVMIHDVCGYDSVLVTYQPVLNKGPFDQLSKADTIFLGQTITLPASRESNIIWSMHPSLSCIHCSNPVASPSVTTTYSATSTVNGCSITDNFTVVVLKDALIRLPNAFTPNGDGRNDVFGPAGKVPEGYQLQIFNRYGEIVFKSSSINNGWDGRYKGVVQPGGAFVYLVQYRNMENQILHQKGTVVLVK